MFLRSLSRFVQGSPEPESKRIWPFFSLAGRLQEAPEPLQCFDDQLEIHSIIIDPDKFQARYFLLFRNSKLEYWGFPHEFARHSDPLYNAIAEYAMISILKEEELEEQKLEEQRKKDEIGKRRKHY